MKIMEAGQKWQAWRAVRLGWVLLFMMVFGLSCCERHPPTGPMILNDFETTEDLDRIAWHCRTAFSLSEVYRSHGHAGLSMTLYPDLYPGLTLILAPAQRHWQGYRSLALEIFNPSGEPLALHYRIDDRKDPGYEDRVNGGFTVQPGQNRLRLNLSLLRTSGTHRPLDLDEISALMFFQSSPLRPVSLGIDYIRLETVGEGD